MSALQQKLGQLFRARLFISLLAAFAARGATAVLVFTLIALISWELDAQTFGIFSILYSIAGLTALVAAGGQQLLLLRSWNEFALSGDYRRLKGALVFCAGNALLGILVIGTALMISLSIWRDWQIAVVVTAYMASFAVVTLTGHLVRAAIGVEQGDGLANILTLMAPITYMVVHIFLTREPRLEEIFLCFPVGALIAIVIHVSLMVDRIKRLMSWSQTSAVFEFRIWYKRSLSLWLYNTLESVNQFLDVLVLGALLSAEASGIYFVLTRLVNAFTVAAGAIHFFSSRHVPRLYFENKNAELNKYLDAISIGCAALVIVGVLGIAVFGTVLLEFFNPDYGRYDAVLLVMSLGTASLLGAGASGVILTFMGYEFYIFMILATTVGTRIVGFFVFIPIFGLEGAAFVTMTSFVLMSGLMWFFVLKLTGLDGSLLRLFRRRISVS